MIDKGFKHSAGGLVIKDNKVLLINWAPPRSSFDFPKGGIDPGETPEQTCIREVREETGYLTKIIQYIGRTSYEYIDEKDALSQKIVDYYLLELDGKGKVNPARENHETFENAWVGLDIAESIITREVDKDILRKALEII